MMALSLLKLKLQNCARRFLYDEKGEVNIVATVVLIGIAVILAVFFKDAIVKLLTSLFDTIFNNANKTSSEIPAYGS